MDPAQLTAALKAEAARLGFTLAGACPAVAPAGLNRLLAWVDAGYAGTMEYIARRREAYADPRRLLAGCRSLLMLAMDYRTVEPAAAAAGCGRVARYAWGDDYHELLRGRLRRLALVHRQLQPAARTRGVVDTAPLLEREYAALAGLGWIGKNTMLLDRQHGSWFFLAALLTTAELAYDAPLAKGYCGSCRACVDACPTQAFVEPGVLDARRCISYLTIEHRGPIDAGLQAGIGEWLFGCDVCQEVCPWNRRALPSTEAAFFPRAGRNPAPLAPWLAADEAAFAAATAGSPLARPGPEGMARNAAVVQKNMGDVAAGGAEGAISLFPRPAE